MNKKFYMYILANNSKTLYTGVTNNLIKRIYEHKNKLIHSFTSKYNISKLVYYEIFDNAENTIIREKQVKGLLRKKKIQLIEAINPYWEDLYENIL